jgi:CubicO group peptidase (beta-lactamase class C family)
MIETQGTAEPQFERVQAIFSESDVGRGGAAFSAYIDGEKVVDLWGGFAKESVVWTADTMATMWSATKGCAALCVQILSDQGRLDVDAPVAKYWPEYAQAGKEGTLVRHFLNHTAGMLCFDDPGAVLDWSGNGWDDYDEIARRIAASPPQWTPGTEIGYHAISVGWLLQELLRRTTGRTLGRFFAEEVAAPLGLSIFIGTPPEEQVRLADPVAAPEPTTSTDTQPPVEPDPAMMALVALMMDPDSLVSRAAIRMHGSMFSDQFLKLPNVRALEIPSANGSGDARSLARMYAVLAQGGALDGHRLVSSESIERFRTVTFSGPSAAFTHAGVPDSVEIPVTRYALGYEGDFGEGPKPWRFGPTPEAFGHLGAGGQVGFADPVRHVSVGFLRNQGADWTVPTALVDALYACL